MNTDNRFLSSPFTIGAIVLSLIAGILMLLHAVTVISQSTQLWWSCLFVVAVVFHIVVNRKQFI